MLLLFNNFQEKEGQETSDWTISLAPPLKNNSKSHPQSQEGGEQAQTNISSKIRQKFSLAALFKGKNKQKPPQEETKNVIEIGERVVTFIEDCAARGVVRYVGEEKDSSGNMQTVLGLEMVTGT